MKCNKIGNIGLKAVCDNEYPKRCTNGSILINTDRISISYKIGKTYNIKVKLFNLTSRSQIIQIQPMTNKLFKLPDETTVSVYIGQGLFKIQGLTLITMLSNCTCCITIMFVSYSITEHKDYLRLKNPTGDSDLAIEICAMPELYCHLPKTIDFGKINIGMTVSKKLTLFPRVQPYHFRIFIPIHKGGFTVEPASGEVTRELPVEVTLTYTASAYVTLSVDIVLYFSDQCQAPKSILVNAVTKPTGCNTVVEPIGVTGNHKEPFKFQAHSFNNKLEIKSKSITPVLNRTDINKMLMEKNRQLADYEWLSCFGEPEHVYRHEYLEKSKDFIEAAQRFSGTTIQITKHGIPQCKKVSPTLRDEIIKERVDKWKCYKNKLFMYLDDSSGDQTTPIRLRERSIRMNHIEVSDYAFSPVIGADWWIRFQVYNKFVNAVRIIIVKVRLEKRLKLFRSLILLHKSSVCCK